MIDLGPSAAAMTALVEAVPDERLGAPTPCPAYTLGDLLDHVVLLVDAFTLAAAKKASSAPEGPPGDAARLAPAWREPLVRRLDDLVVAWRDPAAWTGDVCAGGVEMSGEVAGVVAAEELVVHGWDVARALGTLYDADATTLAAVRDFLLQFSGPGSEEMRGEAYGAVMPVPDDAPLLDRVLGLAGRDPGWRR